MHDGGDRGSRDVSPYLRQPLRSLAEASRDIVAMRMRRWQAQTANQNAAIRVVADPPTERLRSGT